MNLFALEYYNPLLITLENRIQVKSLKSFMKCTIKDACYRRRKDFSHFSPIGDSYCLHRPFCRICNLMRDLKLPDFYFSVSISE